MLLLANSANKKSGQKPEILTSALAHVYSSKNTQQELSNEYQHVEVKMIFKILCNLVLGTKVALALEGLTLYILYCKIGFLPGITNCLILKKM